MEESNVGTCTCNCTDDNVDVDVDGNGNGNGNVDIDFDEDGSENDATKSNCAIIIDRSETNLTNRWMTSVELLLRRFRLVILAFMIEDYVDVC